MLLKIFSRWVNVAKKSLGDIFLLHPAEVELVISTQLDYSIDSTLFHTNTEQR